MSRWTAVSDFDYWDEWLAKRLPDLRCRRCGEPLVMQLDGNERPMWAACEICNPRRDDDTEV